MTPSGRTWGIRFANERRAAGLTQKDVAQHVGASDYHTVWKWEHDKHFPDHEARPKIAAISPGFAALIEELPADRLERRAAEAEARAALEARVAELERARAADAKDLKALRVGLAGLQATVDLLEAAVPLPAAGSAPARKAASTRRGAPKR